MGLYKDTRQYDEDEDIIFGGWTIVLCVAAGLIGLAGSMYSACALKDIFTAHGLNETDIPAAHVTVTAFCSAFALGIGLLNLFAYARRFRMPKLQKRTYKF